MKPPPFDPILFRKTINLEMIRKGDGVRDCKMTVYSYRRNPILPSDEVRPLENVELVIRPS